MMRITHPTKRVFQAFLDAPSDEIYGFALVEVTGLPSGTIYPILRRLRAAGFVTVREAEVVDPRVGARLRRYYRLTAEGQRTARAATAQEAAGLRQLMPGWSH